MHRFRAWMLLALFSVTLIAPAVLSPDTGADLPSCCRRDGNHRCGMLETKARSSGSGPVWQASVCPSFPAVKGLPAERAAVALQAAGWKFEAAAAGLSVRPHAAPTCRAAYDRDCPKRGPPSQA
jgi:hypothetical protein